MDRSFIRRAAIIFIIISFLSLEGCEAFRKKFIRKSKQKKDVEEEIILEPQEYPEVVYDNSTLYKNFYTFWKASHSELLIVLEEKQSSKKQLYYFDEVLKNLDGMKNLLIGQKQKDLDIYVQEISKSKERLSNAKLKDSLLPQLKSKLSRVEKEIRINFIYKKVKDYIKD